MKITVNLSVRVQPLVIYEGVRLAEKGGILRETAIEIMLNSASASPAAGCHELFALELPKEPLFDLINRRKDLALALELAASWMFTCPSLFPKESTNQ